MMNSKKPLKMYNLNVNVATVDGQCTTPRTPEILNSLIAMTPNPWDNMIKNGQQNPSPCSEESSSVAGSPLAGSPTTSPPSVQHTCRQLIKESLKLTLQKRKHSVSDSRDDSDDFLSKRSKCDDLTEEDEERRKRRRERNKIAATKCRMKKRERTAKLVTESETLEAQHIALKREREELEFQRERLMNMLDQHAPHCLRNLNHGNTTLPSSGQGFEGFTPSIGDVCLDVDFGDSSGLLSYSKDPNFGKFMGNMYVDGKGPRMKYDGVYRGNYRCEEEDPDVYRPNGIIDMFGSNDSGYTSFNSNQIDPGCRA